MKRLMFVAALMLGTAAVAQNAPPPPADPAAPPPADSAAPAPQAPPAPPEQMAPPPAAPPAPAPAVASAAPAPQASYPRCSATVTDGCRQGSARESDTTGGKPAHRRHHHK